MTLRETSLLCLLSAAMTWACLLPAHAQTRDYHILINNFRFDPLESMPDIAQSLKARPAPADSSYQLVQFRQPLGRKEMDLLKNELGLKLDQYFPHFTYLEFLSDKQLERLRSLPYFRWSGPFEPAFKISPQIGKNTFESKKRKDEKGFVLLLLLHKGRPAGQALEALATLGIKPLQTFDHSKTGGANRIRVRIFSLNDLPKLAQIPAVAWIEEEGDITLDNGGVTGLIQSNNAANTPIHNNNIRGEGQIVGVIDAMLDMNHCFFNDPANANAGPGHRKVVGFRSDNPTTFAAGATCISGHGTHTAGTIAGFNAGDANNGIAFNSRLSYGDLSDIQFSTGTGTRTFLEYLNAARNDGACIHSNSWSDKASGVQNAYSALSQDLDQFTWDNEDHLVVVSSGNNIDTNSDGVNDSPSPIRPPFSSKNGLCVAASSEANTANVSTGGLGPTFDNRRKPEIYAPGSNTTSSQAGTNCTTFACGGSSMATPAVAAAAALVRQYYMDGWYPSGTAQPHHAFTPSGALIKATLLNSTRDMTGNDAFGQAGPVNGYPTNLEGWGGVVLDDALYFNGDARNLQAWDVRHAGGLLTGEQHVYNLNVATNGQPLKVTLSWTEPPAANASFGNPVINDLDLRVVAPDGTTFFLGNDFNASQSRANGATTDQVNNVEMVLVNAPQTGLWRLEVNGTLINQGNPGQGYALVATADTNNPPPSTGVQNTLVVLTTLPGTNPGGAPSQPNAQNLINEVNAYISEVSYGQTTIDPVFANVTLTTSLGTYLAIQNNPLIEMAEDAIAQLVTANPGVFDRGTADPADDIDRIVILINDQNFTGDWATTGPWPYELPAGLTRPLSVSVSSVFNDPERRLNHAICHQLGLVDLYNHPGVVFAQPHVDNWDIMANTNTVQPMAWSKERALWLSSHHPNSIRWIPRPAPGAPVNQTIPLNWLSSTDTGNPRAIAIGLTPNVANLANENVFYFIEARTSTIGTTDALLPEDNVVLLYYVNENIAQGEGPLRIIDQNLTTPNNLDDAGFGTGAIPPPGGTGLDINVLAPTGSEAFRIQINYDPPATDNDMNIRVGDPHWTSPDIWVDSQEDDFDVESGRAPADRGNAPIAGEDNRIYFTVYNPGPGDAFDVTVSVRVSEPYHTIGGEADFNRFVNQKFYTRIDAGTSVTDFVVWRPNLGDDPHSCIKVEILEVFNDVNDYNNAAQENVQVEESGTASPYEPVEYRFSVTNPYDYYQLFYFRIENLPAGWTYHFLESKKGLSAHERYEGTLTVQPPDDAEVCTDHQIYVTSWMPRGNTLVQYGGATLQVNLRNRTTLTADTRLVRCDKVNTTAAYERTKPKCYQLYTAGCTDPVRANEEIVLRYEDPDGNPVYRVVMTDENGCYSDTYVVTEGGEWKVTATYKGDECSGGSSTGGRPVVVPIDPTGPAGGFGKRLWVSAHAGSTHPLGALDDDTDANIYAAADLSLMLNDRMSLALVFGLAQMTAEIASVRGHPRYFHLNANLEINFPRPQRMKPYLRVGPGWYRDKSGTNITGLSAGLGGKTMINDQLILTPGLDFHFAGFGRDNQTRFLTMHLGLIFK
ncbi:MAG: S8 family serine peptidase [Saprospiraceae bacterium]